MFQELNQKIVLVVGGSQGIGKSIADNFLNEGATIINADIAFDESKLTKVKKNIYHTHLDVQDQNEIKDLAKQLKDNNLEPNILAHVAGISTMDYLLDSQTNDFEKNLRINTRGFYLVAKYITPLIQQHENGKIIVVDSQAGKNGYQGMSAYSASKHAVLGIVKTLAGEIAKNHINVNAVCPGIIETAMKHRERNDGAKIRHLKPTDIKAEDNSQVPLGRTGTPQDVANVVLFLGSHLSDYMTGQAINVTGGMTMN